MTNRLEICCDTCKHGITLRIGLGTQKIQNISFQCPKCKQKISIELSIDKSKLPYQPHYRAIENCVFEKGEGVPTLINIHTEMIYPKDLINEETLMPSLAVTSNLYEHAKKNGFFKPVKSVGFFGTEVLNVFDSIGGDSNLLEDWLVIKKAYSLYDSGMPELMKSELSKYSRVDKVYVQSSLLYSIIFDFLYRFISPNDFLYHELKKNFSKAKQQKVEFKNFKNFYQAYLQNLHWKNYIDILDEYFDNFSEFNRLLVNSKIELHPDTGTESVFCPTNFDDVKMFYGNAYEYITTHLTTFACVNNILNKREYDEFENMTLKKFTELNKDSRLNPLKNNVSFNLFINNIESTLRNASHHKWFYIDTDNPGYLMYRSGGTGAVHKISYIDYIYKSNLLMMKVAIMAMLEIKFLIKTDS